MQQTEKYVCSFAKNVVDYSGQKYHIVSFAEADSCSSSCISVDGRTPAAAPKSAPHY